MEVPPGMTLWEHSTAFLSNSLKMLPKCYLVLIIIQRAVHNSRVLLTTGGVVSIGNVSIKLREPLSPQLVPVKYGQ